MDIKRIVLLTAMVTAVPVPVRADDIFSTTGKIVIGGAVGLVVVILGVRYFFMESVYYCPACDGIVPKDHTYSTKIGCPHRFHSCCLSNPRLICRYCESNERGWKAAGEVAVGLLDIAAQSKQATIEDRHKREAQNAQFEREEELKRIAQLKVQQEEASKREAEGVAREEYEAKKRREADAFYRSQQEERQRKERETREAAEAQQRREQELKRVAEQEERQRKAYLAHMDALGAKEAQRAAQEESSRINGGRYVSPEQARAEQQEEEDITKALEQSKQEAEATRRKQEFEREQSSIRSIEWMMEECCICLGPLAQKYPETDDETLVDLRKYPKHYTILNCPTGMGKHRFHTACIKKHGQKDNRCPLCRAPFNVREL